MEVGERHSLSSVRKHTMNPAVCPSEQQLTKYLLGTLEEDEASQVIVHVEYCAECEAAIETLENISDSVIVNLRYPASDDRFLREPAYQRLLATLEAEGDSSHQDQAVYSSREQTPAPDFKQLDEYELLAGPVPAVD